MPSTSEKQHRFYGGIINRPKLPNFQPWLHAPSRLWPGCMTPFPALGDSLGVPFGLIAHLSLHLSSSQDS